MSIGLFASVSSASDAVQGLQFGGRGDQSIRVWLWPFLQAPGMLLFGGERVLECRVTLTAHSAQHTLPSPPLAVALYGLEWGSSPPLLCAESVLSRDVKAGGGGWKNLEGK